MKKILIFALISLSSHVFGQNSSRWSAVAVVGNLKPIDFYELPLPKLHSPLTPNFMLGIERNYFERKRSRMCQNLLLDYHRNTYTEDNFSIVSEFGYQHKIIGDFSLAANLGVGGMYSQQADVGYTYQDNKWKPIQTQYYGKYSRNWRLAVHGSLRGNYHIPYSAIDVFAGYRAVFVTPYLAGEIPMFLYKGWEVGIRRCF